MAEMTMQDFERAVGKTFPWHELYAPNAAEAREFYVKALDWEAEDMQHSELGVYPMLKANGTSVAGVMGTSEQPELKNVPPHWAVYIGVDDVDARVAKCQVNGGKLIHGPMDVPSVGRMALISDPQGAMFWIYKGSM